jgi:hypothetical protein
MHQTRIASRRCDRTRKGLPRKRKNQAMTARKLRNTPPSSRTLRPGQSAETQQKTTMASAAIKVHRQALLAKNPAQPSELTKLYDTEKNNLKTLFQFGDGSRTYRPFKTEEDFCAFYPFHPYQFELLQASLIALSKHNFFTGRQRSP